MWCIFDVYCEVVLDRTWNLLNYVKNKQQELLNNLVGQFVGQ